MVVICRDMARWLGSTGLFAIATLALGACEKSSGVGFADAGGGRSGSGGGNGGSGSGGAAAGTGGASGSGDGGAFVAHWSFDEGSGNIVVDDRGGLVGRIVGGSAEDAPDLDLPPWVAGRDAAAGTALDLDAAILAWIRVPDTGSLDRVASTNAITMAAWVRPRRLAIQGWDFIASRQIRGTTAEHFGFGFFMAVPACAINGVTVSPPTMNPQFRWMHVAFTYDGTTCRVFRDGSEVAAQAVGATLQPDDTPLALGANIDPPSPDDRTTENLRAIIDDVWLFDRALTSAEIAALAQ
jgi:hypothetical protein